MNIIIIYSLFIFKSVHFSPIQENAAPLYYKVISNVKLFFEESHSEEFLIKQGDCQMLNMCV